MTNLQNNLGLLVLLGILSCTTTPSKDDPIARVNGALITVHDYQNLYETLKPKDLSRAAKEASEIKNLVIKTLVRRAVIIHEAARKTISVSDSELTAYIEKFKNGYTPETFRQSLLEQMVDESEWREQIRQNLLISKIFDATEPKKPAPRPEDALEFFEKNPDLFHQNAHAVALQIVVADKSLADDLRRRLAANPSDFLNLAKKYSIGPEASDSAKISIEKDALPEILDRALFNSPIGKISPVIESDYGFHILKVLERFPALNKDFEEAKPEILSRLKQEQRQLWLLTFQEDLIRSAQIEYSRALIKRL